MEQAKGEADAAFRAGDYREAAERYAAAAAMAQASDWEGAAVARGVHLNYAAALLKVGADDGDAGQARMRDVMRLCETVLAHDAGNGKAVYRSGKALMLLVDADDAQLDAAIAALRQLDGRDAAVRALEADLELRRFPHRRAAPQFHDETIVTRFVHACDDVDTNVLVMLHGMGDDFVRFGDVGRAMRLPQTAVLSLRAPMDLPADCGFAWFRAFDDAWRPIHAPTREEKRRTPSLLHTVDWLNVRVLPVLVETCGYRPTNIFLYGYSQGGTVALEVARRRRETGLPPLGGIVSVSGPLLIERRQADAIGTDGGDGDAAAPSVAGTPVLMTHGVEDNVVPLVDARESQAFLARHAAGIPLADIALHEFPRSHAMVASKAEMHAIFAFLAKHLGNVSALERDVDVVRVA